MSIKEATIKSKNNFVWECAAAKRKTINHKKAGSKIEPPAWCPKKRRHRV